MSDPQDEPVAALPDARDAAELALAAPLAHALALQHCRTDPATGRSCAWYHGLWPSLRALGVAKNSGGQRAFIASALGSIARTGTHPKVLVCGSADYALPAAVLGAYGEAGAALALDVVDVCATPLALVRWHAGRHAVTVGTFESDALTFDPDTRYDAILVNSFLGYFDPAARTRLYARWAAWLRTGGRLVLSNRLRSDAGDAPVGFGAREADTFRETVRCAAQREHARLGLAPDLLASRAHDYALRFRSWPVHAADEVAAGLGCAGFRIDSLDAAMPELPRGEVALAGPSTAEAAAHVRLVATRR